MALPARDKTTSALWVGDSSEPSSRAARLGLWNAAQPHPRCGRGRALSPLHVLPNCARWRSTSRTAALLSNASTNEGVKPPRRDVWREIDAWAVRKVKAHTAPEAVCAGVITAEDRAGNDLAGAACKQVILEHRALRSILDRACWFFEAATGH